MSLPETTRNLMLSYLVDSNEIEMMRRLTNVLADLYGITNSTSIRKLALAANLETIEAIARAHKERLPF